MNARQLIISIALLTSLTAATTARADFGTLSNYINKAKETINSANPKDTASTQSLWNPPVKTPERDQLNNNYTKTIVQGTAMGAGLGAIVAKLKGKDNKEAAKYAIVGGVIGGLIGHEYAKKFEAMAQSKQKTEQQLTALRTNQGLLAKKLDAVEKNIAYIQSEIDILNRQLARNAITKAEYEDFKQQALIELKDAQDAFEKTKLTYAEAQETHKSIVKSTKPDVIVLAPESQKILNDLKHDSARADKMDQDVSSLVKKLT